MDINSCCITQSFACSQSQGNITPTEREKKMLKALELVFVERETELTISG